MLKMPAFSGSAAGSLRREPGNSSAASTRHTAEEWAIHRETIRQLYVIRGLPLAEVVHIMLEDHKFDASKRQYKTRLHDWNFRRSIKQDEKTFMIRKQASRQQHGKETAFTLCGRLVKDCELERQRRIMRTQSANVDMQRLDRNKTPDDIRYFTPPPQPIPAVAIARSEPEVEFAEPGEPMDIVNNGWWDEGWEEFVQLDVGNLLTKEAGEDVTNIFGLHRNTALQMGKMQSQAMDDMDESEDSGVFA